MTYVQQIYWLLVIPEYLALLLWLPLYLRKEHKDWEFERQLLIEYKYYFIDRWPFYDGQGF